MVDCTEKELKPARVSVRKTISPPSPQYSSIRVCRTDRFSKSVSTLAADIVQVYSSIRSSLLLPPPLQFRNYNINTIIWVKVENIPVFVSKSLVGSPGPCVFCIVSW